MEYLNIPCPLCKKNIEIIENNIVPAYNDTCPICLCNFTIDTNKITQTSICQHKYCNLCITQYINQNQDQYQDQIDNILLSLPSIPELPDIYEFNVSNISINHNQYNPEPNEICEINNSYSFDMICDRIKYYYNFIIGSFCCKFIIDCEFFNLYYVNRCCNFFLNCECLDCICINCCCIEKQIT